jgi:hypothetical protein
MQIDFLADTDMYRALVSASSAVVVAVHNEVPKQLIDAIAC